MSKNPLSHEDYDTNLLSSHALIKRVEPILPQGMRVYVDGFYPHQVLWVTYSPPEESKKGKFSAPVNPHQPRDSFMPEMNKVYNAYLAMAQKENKKYGILDGNLV